MIGAVRRGARRLVHAVDGRGWAELTALWVGGTALFTLVATRLIQGATDATSPAPGAPAGFAVGAVLGLVIVVTTAWSWSRDGGRAAQRLGREAWRTGRLPEQIGPRIIALGDLQRRRRLLARRTPQMVVAVIWGVLAAVQIGLDHSLASIVVWTAIFATNLVSGIRDALDRRHLPELDALLEEPLRGAPLEPIAL